MIRKLYILVLATTLLSSCSTHRAYLNEDGTPLKRRHAYTTQFQHFFFFGLGQDNELNLEKICGSSDNVDNFFVKETFFDIFLRSVSIGIYSPRAARVYCKAPSK